MRLPPAQAGDRDQAGAPDGDDPLSRRLSPGDHGRNDEGHPEERCGKRGRKGDIVSVSPGYGRNYLLPRKLAIEVTSSNLKMIEIERHSLKKKVESERQSFQDLIRRLNEVTLTFSRKAGEKDMIFGSVSAADIKDALDRLGSKSRRRRSDSTSRSRGWATTPSRQGIP